MGPNSQVTIDVPVGMPPPARGSVTLTQGDFQVGAITGTVGPAAGLVVVRTDQNIAEPDEYQGGVLRTNFTNYPILSNTVGPNATVTIVADEAPANGDMRIFQGDFSSTGDLQGSIQRGQMTAVAPGPNAGQITVTTDIDTYATRFNGGILRTGGVNYPIMDNTRGPNSRVTITAGTAPAPRPGTFKQPNERAPPPPS